MGGKLKRDSGSNFGAAETSHRLNDTQMTEVIKWALCHGSAAPLSVSLASGLSVHSAALNGSERERRRGGMQPTRQEHICLGTFEDHLPIGVVDTFPQGSYFSTFKMICQGLFNPCSWCHLKVQYPGASQREPDLWPPEGVICFPITDSWHLNHLLREKDDRIWVRSLQMSSAT